MWTTDLGGLDIGVVGMAVGAPFAVLVAEQLAASGADLIISITSAGQIADLPDLPCFVLIDQALRDEGTSLHYQPPARWSHLDPLLADRLRTAFHGLEQPVVPAASWTTEAPYRETATAVSRAREAGAVCVEMESAALYACAASPSCASPTSPTPWPSPATTSTRGRTTESPRPWASLTPSPDT